MRTTLVFLGLALGSTVAMGRCPCEGGHPLPCSGNGNYYFQTFIDNSCPFPPNLLKVEWNGIFGSQAAWLPSASPGLWQTNVFGVTWEAQRVTDNSEAGHWLVSWTVGKSAFQSTSPNSFTNCQESVSWTDSHGTWSVTPCEWVQPTGVSLTSTNYEKTIEFVGIVDPCGTPIGVGEDKSGQHPFQYGRVTPIPNTNGSSSAFFTVYCPNGPGDSVSVIVVADQPPICSTPTPFDTGRFVALYSSPIILTNSGTSIPAMVVRNDMYGTLGCGFYWWAKGGYVVIRLRAR